MRNAFGKMILVCAAIAAMAVCGGQVQASNIVVWTGTSDGDFPSSFGTPTEISFGSFQAGELEIITGSGFDHNHGDPSVVFGIDVHLNGVWTNIDTWTNADDSGHNLSERTSGGSLGFATGTIDGLRLTDTPEVGFAFHALDNTTTFVFEAVPEPSTLALAGLGGIGLVIGAIRRRRQQAVAV